MATIGLYDIDFNHGANFSLSLPLMKAYTELTRQGHQVIMMSPYDKTGRFNKIFYFKDSPRLAVPKGLVIPTDKETKMLGYGFYKTSNLSTKEVIEAPPSFIPYELCSSRIKNKSLFQSIRGNSIIDWREKDFTGARAGASITYVNDRDFLDNPDWEELFEHYDNDINFVHSIRGDHSQKEKMMKFIEKPYGNATRIVFPLTLDADTLAKASEYRGVSFSVNGMSKGLDTMGAFMMIMISKVIGVKITLADTNKNSFMQELSRWNNGGRVSFKAFMESKGAWNPSLYINFPYRLLLSQDPTKITYDELCEEYLVK